MLRSLVATAALLLAPPALYVAPGPAASARQSVDSLRDLPIVTVPAAARAGDRLAVILTGDGGWRTIDKQLADSLADHGIPVVGFDMRHYLGKQRTPEQASQDVARVLRTYREAWGKSHVVLVGYSRGADVMPFVVTRLPDTLQSSIQLVALLGPADNANFKFHFVDLIANKHRADDYPTVPELQKVSAPILCVYGADEKDSACRQLPANHATLLEMPGGHHFDSRYAEIATAILKQLP